MITVSLLHRVGLHSALSGYADITSFSFEVVTRKLRVSVSKWLRGNVAFTEVSMRNSRNIFSII